MLCRHVDNRGSCGCCWAFCRSNTTSEGLASLERVETGRCAQCGLSGTERTRSQGGRAISREPNKRAGQAPGSNW